MSLNQYFSLNIRHFFLNETHEVLRFNQWVEIFVQCYTCIAKFPVAIRPTKFWLQFLYQIFAIMVYIREIELDR